MPRTSRKHRTQPHESDAPSAHDFQRHLLAKAAEVAPSDVTALVARAEEIHRRVATEHAKHATLAHHVRIALHLLADHMRGACPQIPYQTVSVVAAALHYYLEPLDVIPDFIPGFGKTDDAYVFDIAWRVGHPGIERYVEWKGLTKPEAPVTMGAIPMPGPRTARPRAAGSKRAGARKPARRKGAKRR
jgi:uncharacterized membrane protein YkvA (DUF1232 family)